MEATVKNYPKLFKELKSKVKSLLKKYKIKIVRKKFRTNVGQAFCDERKIKVPIIKDIESIYVILHEIGHVVMGHGEESTKPIYLEELEAELFALNILRKWNIHKLFPKDYNQIKWDAQRYVRWNILFAIQRSLYDTEIPVLKVKHIHVNALRFSKIKIHKPKLNVITRNKKKL